MWPLLPLPLPDWPLLIPLIIALCALGWWRGLSWAIVAGLAVCYALLLAPVSWLLVIQIPVHGLFIAAGLAAAWLWLRRHSTMSEQELLRLCIPLLAAGWLGSLLAYLLIYGDSPSSAIAGHGGGQVLFGSLALAIPVWIWLSRSSAATERLAFLNALLPGLLIALALGRLGCVANGCCFGIPGLGLHYPTSTQMLVSEGGSLGWQSIGTYYAWRCDLLHGPDAVLLSRIPVQIYEALGCLALAGLSLWFKKRPADLCLIGYCLLRFGLEFLRGDKPSPAPYGLSDSQYLAILILVVYPLLRATIASGKSALACAPAAKESDHGAPRNESEAPS